jgi:hypothetical protein
MPESTILLVAILYAEAIEAVKSRAPLAASSSELIWNLGKTNSEAKNWNRSQSVNLLTGSERFLLPLWSSKWKIIGRWSESRMSETMTSDLQTFLCTTIWTRHHFPQDSNEWDIEVLKFQNHLYAVNYVVSRLKDWKFYYSKMDF